MWWKQRMLRWFLQCNISSIALMQFDAFTQSRRRVLMLTLDSSKKSQHLLCDLQNTTEKTERTFGIREKIQTCKIHCGSTSPAIGHSMSFHVIPHLQALHRFLWHFSAWEHDISPPKLVPLCLAGKHTGTLFDSVFVAVITLRKLFFNVFTLKIDRSEYECMISEIRSLKIHRIPESQQRFTGTQIYRKPVSTGINEMWHRAFGSGTWMAHAWRSCHNLQNNTSSANTLPTSWLLVEHIH